MGAINLRYIVTKTGLTFAWQGRRKSFLQYATFFKVRGGYTDRTGRRWSKEDIRSHFKGMQWAFMRPFKGEPFPRVFNYIVREQGLYWASLQYIRLCNKFDSHTRNSNGGIVCPMVVVTF